MKISVSLKLYKKKDLDILCACYGEKHFGIIVHEMLESFCKNENFQYEINQIPVIDDLPEEKQIKIRLDETDKFYTVYCNTRDCYKTSFIKTIIRRYLSSTIYQIYQKEGCLIQQKLLDKVDKVVSKSTKEKNNISKIKKKNTFDLEQKEKPKKTIISDNTTEQDVIIDTKETPQENVKNNIQNEDFDMFGALTNMMDLY